MTYEEIAALMHRHNSPKKERIAAILYRSISNKTGKHPSRANISALVSIVCRMPEYLQGRQIRKEVREYK